MAQPDVVITGAQEPGASQAEDMVRAPGAAGNAAGGGSDGAGLGLCHPLRSGRGGAAGGGAGGVAVTGRG